MELDFLFCMGFDFMLSPEEYKEFILMLLTTGTDQRGRDTVQPASLPKWYIQRPILCSSGAS